MNSQPLTLLSPAKLNLHLRVAPPDASGYHPLRSWMIVAGLHDTIRFERGTRDGDSIDLTCDDPTLPCDDTNLVVRAAHALHPPTALPRVAAELARVRHLKIHLTKRIPTGAGLGGGSGNAATTLVGVNHLLGLGRSRADLHAIAATLGSDVPFFLGEPSAIATGRGELLAPCPPPARARTALLVLPPFGVPTAAAYRALDRMRPTADDRLLNPFDAADWARLPAVELLGHLVNDLEPAAFAIEPRLAELRLAAASRLGRIVRMSGSGSTLFTLYDDPSQADVAAAAIAGPLGVRTAVVTLGERPTEFSE